MADGNNVFSPDPVNEVELDLGLNDLVGEDRKYKNPDELAKAYANIEKHARQLEAENAQFRAKVDQFENLNNNNNNNATNKTNQNNPDPTGGEQPPKADQPPKTPSNEAPKSGEQVDWRSQIRDEIKALSEEERGVQNMEAAAAKMVEVYGSPQKANEAVQKRARELGVSVEWLRDSASRSPQAFYATMGMNANSGTSTRTPSSGEGVRLENQNPGNIRNFEYYERIRKENPKQYFTPAVQQEMLKQARTMGDEFYKRG